MKMLKISSLLLAMLLPAVAHAQDQIQPPAASGQQDGLLAELRFDEPNATLRWHFNSSLPSRMDRVSAEFNGRPVTVRSINAYPETGQNTAIMAVVDVAGGAEREDEITDRKGLVAAALESVKAHHLVGLYSAVGGLSAATGADGTPVSPIDALVAFGISEEPADLGKSVSLAMETAAATGATRRGVFLFTGGQSAPAPDFPALEATAKQASAVLYVFLTGTGDASITDGWKRLATATGGAVYEGDAIAAALVDPFKFLDSGARAEVAIDGARRYLWDESDVLRTSLSYGDKTLVLEAPISPPQASLDETVSYIWDSHGRTIGFVLAGAGWAVALILMPFARMGRRVKVVKARDEQAVAASPALAAPVTPAVAARRTPGRPDVTAFVKSKGRRLVFTDAATNFHLEFALEGDRFTVGRARDNAIVIPNDTVSGHHAVIVRSDDGSYNLTNLSETNPTIINGQPTQFAALRNADEIGFGSVRARVILET